MQGAIDSNPLLFAGNTTGMQVSMAQYTGTAAAVGTLTVPSPASSMNTKTRFIVAGLSSETVGVQISSDGTNFTASMTDIQSITTGKRVTAATLGNGTYEINGKVFSKIKFVKSAAVETIIVSVVAVTFPSA